MTKLLSIFILIALLQSCIEQPYKCNCDISEINKNDSILNSKTAKNGLPKLLSRYKQKSLKDSEDESYRVLTKHALGCFFQVYTLTKTEEGGDFIIQEYYSTNHSANDGKLTSEYHSKLSKAQWNSFKKVIEKNCFWSLPIEDPDKSQYLDGAQWIIEGFQPDKRNCAHSDYLITSRMVPSKSKQFYAILVVFMDLIKKNELQRINENKNSLNLSESLPVCEPMK